MTQKLDVPTESQRRHGWVSTPVYLWELARPLRRPRWMPWWAFLLLVRLRSCVYYLCVDDGRKAWRSLYTWEMMINPHSKDELWATRKARMLWDAVQ